jgi:hypothetical protein
LQLGYVTDENDFLDYLFIALVLHTLA